MTTGGVFIEWPRLTCEFGCLGGVEQATHEVQKGNQHVFPLNMGL